MTVKRLRELLEEYEDDAEVFIATQQNYPFESNVKGVCCRDDFEDMEDGESPRANIRSYDDTAQNPADVFLVEGNQVRYGNRDAWEVARR